MKRVLPILFSILLLQTSSKAQFTCSTFTLNGTINIDTGKMVLLIVSDTFYYPHFHGELEVTIKNGHFRFTGPMDYPCAYLLGLRSNTGFKYISGAFMVDPCMQDVSCNIDSIRIIPNINNITWTQFLDKGGKEATKLSVIAFPTHFLLDGKGNIIQKSFSSEELDQFLASHSL